MRRLSIILTMLAALALGAAACGSSSNTSTDTQTTASAAGQASGSTTTAGGSETPAKGVALATADSSFGKIVVDGEGRTLYLFLADNGTTTACTGGCTSLWPALVAPATAGTGVTGTVGDATQADGTKQVTLNGHLLYYYGGDTNPGDTMGQGIGGKWYVVNGAGEPVKAAASSGASSGY
jgi:predicted lipoprotein with Yx(FWY)xxD motif